MIVTSSCMPPQHDQTNHASLALASPGPHHDTHTEGMGREAVRVQDDPILALAVFFTVPLAPLADPQFTSTPAVSAVTGAADADIEASHRATLPRAFARPAGVSISPREFTRPAGVLLVPLMTAS